MTAAGDGQLPETRDETDGHHKRCCLHLMEMQYMMPSEPDVQMRSGDILYLEGAVYLEHTKPQHVQVKQDL